MKTHWLDERIHLDEVPESSITAANERGRSPEGISAREMLEASDEEILRRLPPARMAAKIRQRRGSQIRRVRLLTWKTAWIPVAAMAAAVLLSLVPPRTTSPVDGARDPSRSTDGRIPATPPTASAPPARKANSTEDRTAQASPVHDDGIRLRGGQELSIALVDPSGATSPVAGSVVAGSTLRIVVPEERVAAVWSLDETGTIERHWPVSGDSAAALPAGPLPRDWETDPTTGWERFILVTAPSRYALKDVETHLRGLLAARDPRTRTLSLPAPYQGNSILVDRKSR